MTTQAKKWPIPIGLTLIASLLAPLLSWGYICCLTRYWFDDFCYASVINRLGLLRSLPFEYQHWTGRYTLLLLNAVLGQIGPKTATMVSAVLLLCWLITGTWATHQLFSVMRLPSALISSFVLAALIVFGTLNSTPDIVSSFYWQTGAIVYTLPLVLMMAQAGLLLYVVRKKRSQSIASPLVIASAILAFAAGGCSETYGAVQVAGLSILVLIGLVFMSGPARRTLILMAAAGLIGAVVSLGILAGAPGNDVRQSVFPPHPHLIQVAKSSLLYSSSFVERHTRRCRGTTLMTLFTPLWLAFALSSYKPTALKTSTMSPTNRRRTLVLLGLTPMAVFTLLLASVVPGYYVLAEAPPGRTLFITKFVLVLSTVTWVFIGSLALVERLQSRPRVRTLLLVLSTLAVLALAIVSPLASARRTLSLRSKATAAASQWDKMDREIRLSKSNGAKVLVLPDINVHESQLGFGRAELLPGADPSAPTNRCLADYYELNEITFK